jgi:hypothetical protein
MPNQQRGIRNYQSEDLLKVWKEGLAEVSRSTELVREIERHEGKLLPRFMEQYERLRRLPRRVRRAIQRKWKHSLAGVALLLALGGGSAAATTFNIPCGDSAALIQAINDSNDEVANPGADTIILASNCTHNLTAVDNDTYNKTGLPVISSEMTIEGNGSTIQRDDGMSTPEFRIFAVNEGGDLTLLETTVDRGVGFGGGGGGGVFNLRGTVTITNSTISGNFTPVRTGRGGGVFNGSGTVTITNSAISGNSANYDGGGVLNEAGTLTLTDSTISGNSAYNMGGGISNSVGTVIITGSTISGNVVLGGVEGIANGGGVSSSFGTLTLTNSTISDNSALSGGGLSNAGGTAILINSTITGNFALLGGGLFNESFFPPPPNPYYDYDGEPSIGTVTLSRTLISGNTGSTEPEVENDRGTVIANDFNLFGYDGDAGVSGFSPGATDIVPDVGLSSILDTTLADNGGFTQTHALVSGSPAVDAAGPDCPPPETDQRGVTRPQGIRCDIGAFELQSSPIATPTPTPTSTATPTPAATPTPGPPDRGSNGSSGCSIAQSLETGSTLTNLLIPLLPIFAVGIKYLRRRRE